MAAHSLYEQPDPTGFFEPEGFFDLALVMRSKNAGPFTLTTDIVLEKVSDVERVRASSKFSSQHIAALYGVTVADVAIHVFTAVRTIKVTLPRSWASSGAPGDRDVYGCQQHFPLGDIVV